MTATDKLAWLQALRAIAALMVVVTHSIYTLNERAGLSDAYLPSAALIGTWGVGIFFAISGFIMTHITSAEFSKPRAPGVFLLRRIIRIAPLYWVATSIYVAKLVIEGEAPSAIELFRSFLFIPYLNEQSLIRPIYGLGWTLDYEMYFYGCFALALVVPRTLGLSILVAWLAAPVLLGFAGILPRTDTLSIFLTEPLVLMFLAGVALRSWLWLKPKVSSTAAAVHVPTIFVSLGDASYSIYLAHSFIIGLLARAWSLIVPGTAWWPVFVVLCLLAAAAVGWAVHRVVEVPMMRFLNRLLGTAPQGAGTI